VALEVMNAQRRLTPGESQRGRKALPHQQGPNQARPGRVGQPINGGRVRFGGGQGLPDEGQEAPYMVPGGQFGHHPAVGLVHGHLAVEPMREEPTRRIIDCDRGFIARALDA
jgi:hypothetical protein